MSRHVELPLADAPGHEGCKVFTEDYAFQVFPNKDVYMIIPKGFVTDAASIPGFLQKIFGTPFSKENEYAGVGHDFMYSSAYTGRYSRGDADTILKLNFIEGGHSNFSATIMYLGVRTFGWYYYQTAYDILDTETPKHCQDIINNNNKNNILAILLLVGFFLVLFILAFNLRR